MIFKKIIKGILSLALLAGLANVGLAQQPQAPDGTPLFNVNAQFTNGATYGGYYPQKGTGLVLNVGPGTSYCATNTVVQYTGGTLTLAASNTNYVYLDVSSGCAVSSNTTGFATNQIPIAKVVTGVSSITSILDVRTLFINPSASGGSTVSSVTNSDSTLVFSPTTGAVVGSINLNHSNSWNATQTFMAGLGFDASGATQVKLPVASGYTSAANGEVGYDTTNKNWHAWVNSADFTFAPLANGFVSGHCGQPTSTGGSWVIADTGSACGSGATDPQAVHYNPSTTNYVFSNASIFVVGGEFVDTTATAASCNGTVCTITDTNTYTAGQWVYIVGTWSPSCLSGVLTQVLSAGLSSSQFEISETAGTSTVAPGCSGSTSGTGGTVRDATYFVPVLFSQMQFGSHGTVVDLGQSAVTVATLLSNYSTWLHPYSPAVTGHPAYLFLMAGGQDWLNGDTLSNIENNIASVWAAANADGYTVVAFTIPALDPTGSSQPDLVAINTWMRGQGKTQTLASTNKFWSYLVDAFSVMGNNHQSNFRGSDHIHPSQTGAHVLAGAVNDYLASGIDPVITKINSTWIDTPTTGAADVEQPLSMEASNYPGVNILAYQFFDNSGLYPYWRFNGLIFASPRALTSTVLANNYPSYVGDCWNSGGTSGFFATFNGPDTCIWRDSSGVLDIGNSTFQDTSGSWKMSNLLLASQASDPGSPVNGQVWYNSTSNQLKARINGVTVVLGGSSGGFTLFNLSSTPPVCSNFTQTNFTQATCASKSTRMAETLTPTSSGGIAALVYNTALPATPYTIDMCFMSPSFISGGASFIGLFLEASGGALIQYESRYDSSSLTQPYLEAENWTNFTTFSSNHFTKVTWNTPPDFQCQRITDDGTHRTYWWSENGSDYAQVSQEATNTTITPVNVGIGILSNNTSNVLGPISIYYFNVANSILPSVGN